MTVSMREKVDAIDYKYYVEPNIPAVPLSEEFKLVIKEEMCTNFTRTYHF